MNTMALADDPVGGANPSVKREEPDSRNALVKLLAEGHSSSAKPAYKQTSQLISRLSRNAGAETASIRSRRARSSILAVTSLNMPYTKVDTILLSRVLVARGIMNVLITLVPVSSSSSTPQAKPSQAITAPSRSGDRPGPGGG